MGVRGASSNTSGLPDDVPDAFRRSMRGFAFVPATPTARAKFDVPVFLRSSHPQGVGSAAWNAVREKANSVREAIRTHDETNAAAAPADT